MSGEHRPDGPAPAPPFGPFGGVITDHHEPPTRPGAEDPQADVATQEIALEELREAARRAVGAPREATTATPDVADDLVDLAEAERQEAAGVEAGGRGPDGLEPGGVFDGDNLDLDPMDPRIRDRRVAVTRAEGRRRLRILLVAVSVASAIGIAWLIVQSPFLAVSSVNVRGAARESRAAVEAAAGVKKGSALLFVDTAAVARRVEALPWVAEAKVERDLPNELTITVVERSPVAWVRRTPPRGSPAGTLGMPVLVDRFGRVLGDAPEPPPGLPELRGIASLPERGGRIHPVAPAAAIAKLPDALRAQTARLIERDGLAVLRLTPLPGGGEPPARQVRLGNFDDIAAKGAAALAVLDQLAAGGEHVRYVDVRVPGAPATGD